ncbi:MarC family protein [uncultured Acetobacteroides sp.]|uniref:MarC family protein n=1 Tax=uncultured Acetobacteroides sp. TaxID=1760811 RepID=UPI0029F59B3B|nr:MarC family protein [uncultured Acetobacteroides sp.]
MESLFDIRTEQFFSVFVTMLALVNPVQKIFVMLSLDSQLSDRDRRYVALKSNLVAAIILLLFLALGNAIFTYVFNINLYAFRITCGFVLLYNGFLALQEGILIKIDPQTRLNDVSAVPIAMPMIAGPGTITAAVTLPNQDGTIVTILAILAVIATNTFIMLHAKHLGGILNRFNLMSPLIRILGLIIATIGVQMCFTGIKDFLSAIGMI